MAVTDKTPKVGIAGAGLMGRWHAHYIRRSGANLVAVFDQDPSRARELVSDSKSKAPLADSFEDMLARLKPDIVHICTPLDTHFQLATCALQAGTHVVVEKPLTDTAAQAAELIEVARKNRLQICPVHQMSFQRGVRDTLKQLNTLGDILEMRFTICSAGGQASDTGTLNAIVADIIPHPLSIIQTLQPGIKLDTGGWNGVNARDGELQVIGTADGIAIDISISMTSRPTRCELDLFCSGGRVFLNFFHGYAVIEKGGVSRLQKIFQPFKYSIKEFVQAGANATRRLAGGEMAYPGLADFLDSFYQSVTGGTAPPVSFEQALAVAYARDDLAGRFLMSKADGV
jgi:predicted dehydrogenase